MELNSFNMIIFVSIISSPWIQPSLEIINGKDVDITEFPWTVTINGYMDICKICNDFNCGGAIIGKKWILTAAHCDTGPHWLGGFLIRAGSNHPLWLGERIDIERSILHPQYKPDTKEHDIQLVELKEELEYSNKIKAIRMADQNFTITENFDVKIAGCGYTCTGCFTSSLLKADLTTCEPITYPTKAALEAEEVICAHDKNELQASELIYFHID